MGEREDTNLVLFPIFWVKFLLVLVVCFGIQDSSLCVCNADSSLMCLQCRIEPQYVLFSLKNDLSSVYYYAFTEDNVVVNDCGLF